MDWFLLNLFIWAPEIAYVLSIPSGFAWVVMLSVWVVGCTLSAAAYSVKVRRHAHWRDTDGLALLFVTAGWFVFWPCYAVYKLFQLMYRSAQWLFEKVL